MKIKNFDYSTSSNDFDIIHHEKTHLNDALSQSSEILFETNGITTRIKFELTKDTIIDESDFLFIPETNMLFYRGTIEWCAFDLTNKIVARNETATQFPFIERRNDVVVVFDDLYAESMNLKAETIDKVPIDPPSETTEYEDRIEFNSPIFGKQLLKLIK